MSAKRKGSVNWLRWLIALGALNVSLGVAMLAGGYGDSWLYGCYRFLGSCCVWADRADLPVHFQHYGRAAAEEEMGRAAVCEAPGRVDVLTFESRELEDVFPASEAMRWALLLRHLRQGGAGYAAVSSPFDWVGMPGDLEQATLRSEVEAFAFAGFGLRGELAAGAVPAPVGLESSALDGAQVKGDCTRLPAMNRLLPTMLCRADFLFPVPWGVDWVANDERFFTESGRERSMPLLVRWNGRVYPTLPLRLALARSGAVPADVHAEVGKCLRIGGAEWLLDDCGRIPLPKKPDSRHVSLNDVLKVMDGSGAQGAGVVVVEERTLETRGHAALLADTLSALTAERPIVRERAEGKFLGVELREWNPLAYWGWVLLLQGVLILVLPRCRRSVQVWCERVVWVSVPVLALVLLWQMVWLPFFGLAAGVAFASVMGRCLRPREARNPVWR